jgi:uncharacterized membrane protein
MTWILKLNLAATLYMTGLIWFVQLVHYPLFSKVGGGSFAAYESLHRYWTGFAVGPAMLLELLTAVLLVMEPAPALRGSWAWAGLALVAVVWASTFFLQVPEHDVLQHGFDARSHQRLVMTNWIRTAAWTLRAGLLLWVIR